MSDDILNFDELEKEAMAKKEANDKEAAEREKKESKPFANWTKGPLIIGGICALLIIGVPLFIIYCL